MTEGELRALVRDAVARHMGGPAHHGREVQASASLPPPLPHPVHASDAGTRTPWTGHASHALYLTIINTGESCVIEPAATCDHCGYCKSHGH